MREGRFGFSQKMYDVVVIGGGIYGAWVAWDAALRGLSVALVDKGDFGHATSSNSSRIAHGGLRYLQHGDLRRMRQSTYERMVLMNLAPTLVCPVPFLIPTYGHGLRSKWILRLAIAANELIGIGVKRIRSCHPVDAIPPSYLLSKGECSRLLPGVIEEGLTGGVIHYEAQISSSERLLLSVVLSAVKKGLDAANYLEAIRLLRENHRIVGITARDVLTGDELDIRGKVVVNAAGPWVDRFWDGMNGYQVRRKWFFCKAFDLLIDRQLIPEYAVGVYGAGRSNDPDALLDKGARLLFLIPWRNGSMVGTALLPYGADPDNLKVTEEEILAFLQEINAAYPPVHLTRQEVRGVYVGLVPAVGSRADDIRLLKHHQILDPSTEVGIDGLICVTGVKFTEARVVAEKVVDLVFRKLGKVSPKSTTATTPLHGQCPCGLKEFVGHETRNPPRGLSAEVIRHLIVQYGSAYSEVLDYLENAPEPNQTGTKTLRFLRAQVLHGIREEMAQRLTDVVFRRTDLGRSGGPRDDDLMACADVMAEELGWTPERKRREVELVKSALYLRT